MTVFFEKVNVTTDVQQNEQGIIMNNGTLSVTSFMFFNLLYILILHTVSFDEHFQSFHLSGRGS